MLKEHKVSITISSESFGIVNQSITVTEYAATPEELVYKHQSIGDAVITALNGKNEDGSGGVVRGMSELFLDTMADAGGDLTKALDEQPWRKRNKGKDQPEKR